MTELYIDQVLATLAVSLVLGLDFRKVIQVINKFKPKENRLVIANLSGRKVFFDGDATYYARIKELSKNFYKDTTLIISNFELRTQFETRRYLKRIISCFKHFTRVHINQEIDYFRNKNLPLNTKLLKKEYLLDNIPDESVIFYHSALFFRRGGILDKMLKIS